MITNFMTNTVGMAIDGYWCLQTLAPAVEEDGLSFGIATIPIFDRPVACTSGAPFVIFKGADHAQEAAALIQYLLNPEYTMPNLESGLWQPAALEWYTNPELIDKWIREDVHTPDIYDACLKFAAQYTIPSSTNRLPICARIDDLYLPALDALWSGTASAEECIATVMEECEKIFDEYLAGN